MPIIGVFKSSKGSKMNFATCLEFTYVKLRQRMKLFIGGSPLLYRIYLSILGREKRFPVSDSCLTIEGFPRSANTFALYVARELLADQLISSHVHNIASLRRAADLGCPCVVLFRNPRDAIISLAIKESVGPQSQKKMESLFKEWCIFYRYVLNNTSNYLLLSFDDVIKKPDRYVTKLSSALKREVTATDALNIVAAARIKIESKEGVKSAMGSSLPSEIRNLRRQSYIELISGLPNANEAMAIYRELLGTRSLMDIDLEGNFSDKHAIEKSN
jgi:hypothetical protein